MITLESHICQDPEAACTREWIETNGLGGFASSTIIGMNTRRYHGLLVASLSCQTSPQGRFVLLSKFEETIVTCRGTFEISANQYPGIIHPQGYQYLESFRLTPFPQFVYAVGGVKIEKTIFMVHGENTTVVLYRALPVTDGQTEPLNDSELYLRPLLAFRDYHSLSRENEHLNPLGLRYHTTISRDVRAGQIEFFPYEGMPSLYIAYSSGDFQSDYCWYRNFEYKRELDRGLDAYEDLFSPGVLKLRLAEDQSAIIIASTKPHRYLDVQKIMSTEAERREELIASLPLLFPNVPENQKDFAISLWRAADSFIIRRSDGRRSIIAGYHWFTDWGRDTMISLPGLTLTTGRYDVAEEVLRTYADYCDEGMIPNRFPDKGGQPEYNTIDATLWFFYVVHHYLRYAKAPFRLHSIPIAPGGYEFVRECLFETMKEIIDYHRRGTRYNIKMDEDCLLAGGEERFQLTWMDAKVGDWVVTPRHGKPVEVNALWYNALKIMQGLAEKFGENELALDYSRIANRAKRSFNHLFWNEEEECLYDCIDTSPDSSYPHFDDSIRPNQIFAVSLPYSLLPRDRERKVVEKVFKELYTPFGLRSLSIRDGNYRGRYGGDQSSRDGAYHQGTVWAWLIGHFVSAYLKVNGVSPSALQEAMSFLSPFIEHLTDAGIGTISEIFDGDPPHTPKGCISQAWSVGELLRSYGEIMRLSSKFLDSE